VYIGASQNNFRIYLWNHELILRAAQQSYFEAGSFFPRIEGTIDPMEWETSLIRRSQPVIVHVGRSTEV
jgi:hypothetical protein